MTTDDPFEGIFSAAAEFGYTREQVLGWNRADLIRFGDLLQARVEIEQAGLAVMRDIAAEVEAMPECHNLDCGYTNPNVIHIDH